MKTAMQELIEQMHPNFFTEQEKAYLLDKEKHQIIDAHSKGVYDCMSGKQYYNDTYETK